eukprot:272699-Rhodomonas_salina.1
MGAVDSQRLKALFLAPSPQPCKPETSTLCPTHDEPLSTRRRKKGAGFYQPPQKGLGCFKKKKKKKEKRKKGAGLCLADKGEEQCVELLGVDGSDVGAGIHLHSHRHTATHSHTQPHTATQSHRATHPHSHTHVTCQTPSHVKK